MIQAATGNHRRILKPITTIMASISLFACYQTSWKVDYASPIEDSRNYSVTSASDNQGNLLVGGASAVEIGLDNRGNTSTHFQALLQKYNSQGELLWQFEYDNGLRRDPAQYQFYNGGAEISSIAVASDNSIFAAGMVPGISYETNPQDYDLAVYKINENGDLIWQQVFENPSLDTPIEIGINGENTLLLAVGHINSPESGSVEALALSSSTGEILWSHEHETSHIVGYSLPYRSAADIHPSSISENRIAIASPQNEVWVYDSNGNLIHQLPSTPDQTGPNVNAACTAGVAEAQTVLGLGFDNQALYVTEANTSFGCLTSLSQLSIKKYNSSGDLIWTSLLPDTLGTDTDAEYVEFLKGNRSSYAPFSIRSNFLGSKILVAEDSVYITSSATSRYHHMGLFNPVVNLDSLVFAVNKNGVPLWTHEASSIPLIIENQDSDEYPTILSTWQNVVGLSIAQNNDLILALNTQKVEGEIITEGSFRDANLIEHSSTLLALNPTTGEADYFGYENGLLARSISTSTNNQIIKVGDNYTYRPAWWWAIPDTIKDATSLIHISAYNTK